MDKSLRILILEDNPADAELAQFELQEAGLEFTSKVVMTEKDYIHELTALCPDLILSDYDLPKYNGVLALSAARKICPDIPFILVSGVVSEDRAIEILTQGAKDYVLKNRLQLRLVPAVRRALAEAEEIRTRKKAEAELREAHRLLEKQVLERTAELWESRERLSMALTSSGMGTFDWNITEDKRYWDDNLHLQMGIKREDFSGTTEALFQAIHPEDRNGVQEAIDRAFAQDVPYRVEYRVVWPDGSVHHIAARGKVHRDDAGRPVRIIGVSWDITDRKRAEEALRESEAFTKLVLDNLPVGIAVNSVDPAVKFDYLNDNFLKYYRTTREKLADSDNFWTAVYENPEFREEMKNRNLADCASGDPERMHWEDVPISRIGEGTTYISARNIPISDRKLMISTVWDVTERKTAETALQKSYDLLANLTEQVPGVVYQYRLHPDERSCYPYASQGMNDIYEVTPEEVREDASIVFGRLHPDDRDRVVSLIRESARTLALFHCEYRVVLPRQGLRWRLSDAKPMGMEDGSTLWHGIITDITDRKRAEVEQEKLQAQLLQAQKMESIGRLAGGVAHDFNNMLGVILGHTEMALEQVDPAQPLHFDLQEIRKAAERSTELTRQLLAFARKQTISPRVLDLNQTVEGMLKMLRRLIGEDIHLSWTPGRDLWPVKVDPSQIDQILANLCVNARDAIAGVGKITIETGNTTFDEAYCGDHVGYVPGEYVLLAVSDDGCGMDKETLGKLFEPFFTTKELGKGTGLGLATVYGIVKQNNGFLNVYSEPGQGTTFRIYLPRYAGKAEQARTAAPQESAMRGRETILVVEDEPEILNLTKRMLEKQGYHVLTAGTPGEAIRLAEEHAGEIHLLMTDVVMPEMNGRDLAKRMISFYPNIRRLFMSGYTANVIAHHGVLDEGVHFIQKPFSIRDLAAKVRQALDQT